MGLEVGYEMLDTIRIGGAVVISPVGLSLLILLAPAFSRRPKADVLEAFMDQNYKSEPTYLT